MTPAAIIQQAQADGVTLAVSTTGAIKVAGTRDAVDRWVAVIREHKTELLAALRAKNDAKYLPSLDPASKVRQLRLLGTLRSNPALKYAVVADVTSLPDTVILTMAIRDVAAFDVHIPREKYDGVLLLDLIDRYGTTLH